MHEQQRGISLIQVAIIMSALAALAMAAIYSMRYERNLFALGLAKLSDQPVSQAVLQKSQAALQAGGVHVGTPAAGVLRKCIINGKTVLSDVDCADRTSQVVQVHQTHGFDAPHVPAPDPDQSAQPAVPSAQDQAIEKATR